MRVDGGQTLGFAGLLEGFERDVAEHRHRLCAHAGIRVVAHHERQNRRVHQFPDRRPTNAGALVLARRRRQRLAVVDRQRLDVGEPHFGIGMLVGW